MEYGAPIEIKEVKEDGDDWVVEGYASTYGNVDQGFDVVMPGAFDETLKSGRRVGFFHSHDPRMVLGKTLSLKSDKKGLFGKFKISKTQLGEDTRQLIIDDAMGGLSIGYRARKYGFSENGDVRQLEEIELFEVSAVALPMNEEAVITRVKNYWPGMTLAEKTQALAGALEELLSDTRAVAQAGPGPLNQTKRQELEQLLETLSGLDAARSDVVQILESASPIGMAAWKEAKLKIAEMERLYLKE